MPDFKTGDVVQLITGSPQMICGKISQNEDGQTEVECHWFSAKDEPLNKKYLSDMLRLDENKLEMDKEIRRFGEAYCKWRCLAGGDDFKDGYDKLHQAVCALIGPKDHKERLIVALKHLCAIKESEYQTHLPREIVSEVNELKKEMILARPANDEGDIRAIVNTFDEEKVKRTAIKILECYDVTTRYQIPWFPELSTDECGKQGK